MRVTVFMSPTPPLSPANGELWFDTERGKLMIFYVDVDSGQWLQI